MVAGRVELRLQSRRHGTLVKPATSGEVRIFGCSPREEPARVLPRVGFLAQERPLYKGFTVEEMLTMGRRLNPRWDDGLARVRLQGLDLPLERKVGRLSGGQQAQVALVLALAKRPELLLLAWSLMHFLPFSLRDGQ